MPAIKALLFDLDDTLWPIVPVIVRAENLLYEWLRQHAPGVAQRFSIEALRERRMALMQTDPVYQLDLQRLRHAGLLEAFAHAGEDPALVDRAMEVFSRARNQVQPYEDVLPALDRLRQRTRLGSVTNGVADLETIGIAHYFDASIAACRFGRAKPDPAIFHVACDALGVAPQQAAYVGDDLLLDVEGAQKAGLRAVWLRRAASAPATAAQHVRPDAICGNLYEVETWLTAQS
jgi:putative hydrolase of the HAD superfamily